MLRTKYLNNLLIHISHSTHLLLFQKCLIGKEEATGVCSYSKETNLFQIIMNPETLTEEANMLAVPNEPPVLDAELVEPDAPPALFTTPASEKAEIEKGRQHPDYSFDQEDALNYIKAQEMKEFLEADEHKENENGGN